MLVHSNLEDISSGICIAKERSTFKIGHVGPDIGVQCVDNHFPVCGAGDLRSSVDKARSRRGTSPRYILTNVLGFWQEVWQDALV